MISNDADTSCRTAVYSATMSPMWSAWLYTGRISETSIGGSSTVGRSSPKSRVRLPVGLFGSSELGGWSELHCLFLLRKCPQRFRAQRGSRKTVDMVQIPYMARQAAGRATEPVTNDAAAQSVLSYYLAYERADP